MKPEIQEVETAEVRHTAVSVYGDAMDDFPVLKAFQQYIDAEQARARKRLLSLGVFFGVLMLCVIAVFVVMLVSASQRNQTLNDRLVEYAMRDRDRQSAVVVQQPAVKQDNSAILALTAKVEEMQQKLLASQKRAEEAERAEREEAKKKKSPSAEEIEIRRLRTLLAAEQEKISIEREKLAAEQARLRKEELEAYRRKQYPELYETETPKPKTTQKSTPKAKTEDDLGDLDDNSAINYFSEESSPAGEKTYSIPVDVRGSKSKWRIPKD